MLYSNSTISGFSNFYYISKLDDGGLIKLPYRMIGVNWEHLTRDTKLKSSISLEYLPKNDILFSQNDPQDFLLDLRELYFTWYLGETFGNFIPLEISIGKQFNTWGFVDQNSPLDVVNPIDYNYLFEVGTQRKLANVMGKINIEFSNLSVQLVSSPFHAINRFPSSSGDIPVELPALPREKQFWDDDDFMGEYGANLSFSLGDRIDLGASYFNGKGRIFNLSGINVHNNNNSASETPDTVFSYRSTQMVGGGMQYTGDNFILSFDGAYFKTEDDNKDIERAHPYYPWLTEIYENRSYSFEESVEYYQYAIQIETELLFDVNFVGQLFKNKIIDYKALELPIDFEINLPQFEFNPNNFDTRDYFYPDMGSSLGFLTNEAILFGLQKSFNQNRLLVNYKNISDLEYKGSFNELGLSYKINDNTKVILAINSIAGDDSHPKSKSSIEYENEELEASGEPTRDYVRGEDYPFNQMKDYSHIRFQIKFNF